MKIPAPAETGRGLADWIGVDVDESTCPQCRGVVPPAAGSRHRIYCSQACRQLAKDTRKTERYRSDPDYRATVQARMTAKRRARGERPQRTGATADCPECGTEFDGILGKVYCSAHCRNKASHRRERYRIGHVMAETVIGGCADTPAGRTSIPVRVVVEIVKTGGLVAYCPNPNHSARAMMSATDLTTRRCPCGTAVRLNEEEASWVIYETLSTSPSRRTA